MSGCSDDGPGLPSLGGDETTRDSDLETTAKAFLDCMSDAGLPVELAADSSGALVRVAVGDGHVAAWQYQEKGIIGIAAGDDGLGGQANEAVLEQMIGTVFDAGSQSPKMMIDGIDHTDQFVGCVDQTGYDESLIDQLILMDPASVATQVQVNNQWAACARANGWPFIKDTFAPKPGENTYPMVLLPETITESQLRQLLDACPNFDPEHLNATMQWYEEKPNATSRPDGYKPQPMIGFDAPGADSIGRSTLSPQELAVMERLAPLFSILYEKQIEYLTSQERPR